MPIPKVPATHEIMCLCLDAGILPCATKDISPQYRLGILWTIYVMTLAEQCFYRFRIARMMHLLTSSTSVVDRVIDRIGIGN